MYVKLPNQPRSGVTSSEKRFDEFERVLLYNWSTALANPTLWYITFTNIPPMLRKAMDSSNLVNLEGPNHYAQLRQNQINIMNVFDKSMGCMVVHGVTIPSISVDAKRADTTMGGYYGGMVANRIDDSTPLTVEFRETQSSIVDFIVRPWIELVAKNGLIARNPTDKRNVKCTISIHKFGVAGEGTEPVRRKSWNFFNACPASIVGTHRLTHENSWSASDMFMPTEWVYSHYTVRDVPQLDGISDQYNKHIAAGPVPKGRMADFADRVGDQGGPSNFVQ